MPKSLVISRRGEEEANESLREFHVKEARPACMPTGREDAKISIFLSQK
jgi:hypothetical protein